ncbi:MAG: cytochrome c maturation protein CcmE [Cardiobacteriaceae bacterium]|nr:cytochrome c maturation protein CcmE [Cardiobacteriaceae bacterium]
MNPNRKKRLTLIGIIFVVFALAVGLMLYAMQSDLNHYYSLDKIASGEVPVEQPGIRVGGMVEQQSLERKGDSLDVVFRITDFRSPPLTLHYSGILPDLFREGQGVIARGTLGKDGIFRAEEILAKHDENYMPPEVAADLEKVNHPGYGKPQSGQP